MPGWLPTPTGDYYGTTKFGGLDNLGTIYQVTSDGSVTTRASFNITNGAYPVADLTLGTNGDFYGTTCRGGASDWGTLFQMTPEGDVTVLMSFGSSNSSVELLSSSDGPIYGVTGGFGNYTPGAVFELMADGTVSNLVSLSTTVGGSPLAGLIQGADGDFYGTGSANGGTIFKVTPNGSLSALNSTAPGTTPAARLVQAANGNFYGTTLFGGVSDDGILFQMAPNRIRCDSGFV